MNHFNEGNKFYTEKQFQKAINSYRLSIDSNVNVPCSYYNIGVCYIKLRDFDSAIKMPLHSDTTEKILESLGINSIDDFNNPQKGEILHREFK